MNSPRPTVLVVDDEPHIRDLVGGFLGARNCNVVLCGDGAAALDLAGRIDPAAVVTDLRMPGMDGLELARHLRAGGSQVPVVLHTGFMADDRRVRAFSELPDVAVVPKGDISALAAVVLGLVQRSAERRVERRPVSASTAVKAMDAGPVREPFGPSPQTVS